MGMISFLSKDISSHQTHVLKQLKLHLLESNKKSSKQNSIKDEVCL
jgi:hypothetical protein